MTVTVVLPEATLEVVPGRSAPLTVLVTNHGRDASQVVLEVQGRAADWVHGPDTTVTGSTATSYSPAVSVPASSTQELSVVVAPPRGAGAPGQLVPFSVRARTADGARLSAPASGLLCFTSTVPVTGTLTPARAEGPRVARHLLQISTEEPNGLLVTLRPETTSPVTVVVEPVALRVGPGQAATAHVLVRALRPVVRGPRRHAFTVLWETEGHDGLVRGSATGQFEQTPRIPPVASALLVTLALVGALFAAWALRPTAAPSSGAARAGAAVSEVGPTGSAPSPGVTGPAALVDTVPADVDPGPAEGRARQQLSELGLGTGVLVRVVDGGSVPGFRPGFRLVLVEGFRDDAAARAFCGTWPGGACRSVR